MMSAEIVFRAQTVTLVGGGAVYPGDLELALTLAPKAVAVDGGADTLVQAGHIPDVMVGDMDSVSPKTRAMILPQNLYEISEQDSTDFEKALSRIAADVIVGVGFSGGRMDHAMAGMHALLRFAHQPIVLLAETEIMLLAPPRLALDLPAGDVVSLYPLAPCTGRSEGLFWPIDGLAFEAGRMIGTSNKAVGGPMLIEMAQRGAVLMLPKAQLGAVTQALRAGAPEHVRWPVHG